MPKTNKFNVKTILFIVVSSLVLVCLIVFPEISNQDLSAFLQILVIRIPLWITLLVGMLSGLMVFLLTRIHLKNEIRTLDEREKALADMRKRLIDTEKRLSQQYPDGIVIKPK